MENENPNILSLLPEDCTEKVLVFTSPVDVCRVSVVSKSLQSAADSDSVWEKFLPSDYQSIISASLTPIPDFGSKKDLFPEVVKLRRVWWLEIRGTIRVGVLSPRTSYVAYIVYKLKNDHGFHFRPSEVSVGVCGVELDTQFAFLVPKGRQYHPYKSIYRMSSATEDELEQLDDDNEEAVYIYFPCPYGRGPLLPVRASNLVQSNIRRRQLRDDGWFEIELGEFYTENEDDCIEMSLKEVNDCLSPKDGLIVEGIEIRPRMG
ncbi:hypothetical protein T459_31931 [Capsicum annuum]|uniref:F-box domain-containing protein n=1 Tax=Capsicum annuum TaxID=4072 RepID=A0A2G2Y3W5_CAPAN|nr:hypothetical protein T459_31931 [Capsicum annuum]